MRSRLALPLLLVAGWLSLALTSCSQPEPTTSPLTSPISMPPTPPREVPINGPAFTLDSIRGGADRVSGTGPAGLPIRIIDISQVGAQIGSGVIEETGHFEILVAPPVVGGNRIGIQVGDLSGTSFRGEDFLSGPGYRDIPMVGIVLTSTLSTRE
jgi:hypothetical protein